jgi:hypothetical protein
MSLFRSLPCVPSTPPLARILVVCVLMTGVFVACNDTGWPTRAPVVADSVGADALTLAPAANYALAGETLLVSVSKLKTVYECSRVLSFAPTATDSGLHRFISFAASIEKPGTPECPITPGVDTSFTLVAPNTQRTLILRTPFGKDTDTVFIFTGTSTPVNLRVVTSDTVHTVSGFTFRDSTAGNPHRRLIASLNACAVIPLATYTRLLGPTRGVDTLSLEFRILTASPALPDSLLSACAGSHTDTVNVVKK